jgi:lipopolysaccharide transport system ATP-binding protein
MRVRPAVRAEGLGKEYPASHAVGRLDLRDSLGRALRRPLDRARDRTVSPRETIWALRDVDLEVPEGEVTALLGRNGAGKSTLLRLLCRVTPPTAGRIELYGRVGSLLDATAGFHPELTGRENVYLSGTIFGMRRKEIDASFAAIAEFADIGEFLDTPVKRYSTGMHVRLGFSVAAHLRHEILVVDEALAVGDPAFQRKCVAKIEELANGGRTVVLVTHSMETARRLCSRAILLEHGRVRSTGPTDAVIADFERALAE